MFEIVAALLFIMPAHYLDNLKICVMNFTLGGWQHLKIEIIIRLWRLLNIGDRCCVVIFITTCFQILLDPINLKPGPINLKPGPINYLLGPINFKRWRDMKSIEEKERKIRLDEFMWMFVLKIINCRTGCQQQKIQI